MATTDIQRQSPAGCAAHRQLFEDTVTRLMDRLYGTALRLARNPDDAEDIVAEALGQAWGKLDQLRDPGKLEAWLFRILNNCFIDACRRRRSRQDRETELEEAECEDDAFSLFEQLHQPFLVVGHAGVRVHRQVAAGGHPAGAGRPARRVPGRYRAGGNRGLHARGVRTPPRRAARHGALAPPPGPRSQLQKALWQQGREAGLVPVGRHRPVTKHGGAS